MMFVPKLIFRNFLQAISVSSGGFGSVQTFSRHRVKAQGSATLRSLGVSRICIGRFGEVGSLGTLFRTTHTCSVNVNVMNHRYRVFYQ